VQISEQINSDRIYPPLNGTAYVQGLRTIHAQVNPEWYFEIGSFKGNSLKLSKAKTIAVDPNFQLSGEAISSIEELHLFQMTSDDFFASGRAERMTKKLDLAFLDGMHLFEFLLRDFINTEKLCSAESVVVMHDCIPMTGAAAEREWDRARTGVWTGDVWKLVPILRKYRPDLSVQVLDCPPSGLTVISNLDPESKVLEESYEKIVKEYMDLSIESFGTRNLLDELKIESSRNPQTFEDLART